MEEFVASLQKYGVRYLIDVRCAPYSRHKAEFNREALCALMRSSGISTAGRTPCLNLLSGRGENGREFP